MFAACGTKKDEKKVTAGNNQDQSEIVDNNNSEENSSQNCAKQSANQNDECQTKVTEEGRLVVLSRNSWLNPKFDNRGYVQENDGRCLNELAVSSLDSKTKSNLDIKLNPMGLTFEDTGFAESAHCLVRLNLAYKTGYAFAIRKVKVPLKGNILDDSMAYFKGSYGIVGKETVVVSKTLNRTYDDKAVLFDHTVADQNIVWSSCSGRSALVVDTRLSMDFSNPALTNSERQKAYEAKKNGTLDHGDIQLDSNANYRLEILWARCK